MKMQMISQTNRARLNGISHVLEQTKLFRKTSIRILAETEIRFLKFDTKRCLGTDLCTRFMGVRQCINRVLLLLLDFVQIE